jgi:RNA polymerase sigma factor (sigma-70 family)
MLLVEFFDSPEGDSSAKSKTTSPTKESKCSSRKASTGRMVGTSAKAVPVKEAHPTQQASLYNPDGTTYRQEKMPSYSNDDIYSRREPIELGPEHEPAMAYKDQSRELGSDAMIKRLLKSKLELLDPREKQIMYSRFYQDKTLEQLANEYGVGVERIRQIEARALRKLRHHMKDTEVTDFYNVDRQTYESNKR